MTNNPREQAIEKIAMIIVSGRDFFTSRQTAAEILDALNIEIVSKESEPQEGDLVKATRYNGGVQVLYDFFKTTGAWISDIKIFGIVQRNNKPAVYVENIGVKL